MSPNASSQAKTIKTLDQVRAAVRFTPAMPPIAVAASTAEVLKQKADAKALLTNLAETFSAIPSESAKTVASGAQSLLERRGAPSLQVLNLLVVQALRVI